MPTPYEILHTQKKGFLLAFIETAGNITRAAERAGISRQSHYEWLWSDEEYKAAFETAKTLATDRLADEITRRAFEGVTKPVYQGGKHVGNIQEYSDTLLIFAAKAADPNKYRERQTIDSNVNASMTVDGKIGYQAYGEAVAAPAVVETLPAARHEDEDDKEDASGTL